jgi:hypothetical protein
MSLFPSIFPTPDQVQAVKGSVVTTYTAKALPSATPPMVEFIVALILDGSLEEDIIFFEKIVNLMYQE